MEQLLEAIRAATAPDATDETRAAGANACRTILTALEAKAGQPLASVQPTTAVQSIVGLLGTMPPEQLLDLAIARLKAALPPGTDVAPVKPLKIQLLPLPAPGGRS
jgi:hypothetical protein